VDSISPDPNELKEVPVSLYVRHTLRSVTRRTPLLLREEALSCLAVRHILVKSSNKARYQDDTGRQAEPAIM
jgi:hypothetical protein